MTVLKFTDLLLLFLMTGMTRSSDNYECMNRGDLMNCTSDNSRVSLGINKNHDHYRLSLCFNNTCIGNWNIIRCDQICQRCQEILGLSCGDVNSGAECENLVDIFLNNYCESAKPPAMLVAPSMTSNLEINTVPITTTALTFSMKCQSNEEINHSQAYTVVVFGTLFSISMLLLAVVIAGWVCTAYCMHKRYSQAKMVLLAQSSQTDIIAQHGKEDEVDKNPAYGVTCIIKDEKNPAYGVISNL